MSSTSAVGACPHADFIHVGTGAFPRGFTRFDDLQAQNLRIVQVEEPAGSYHLVLDRDLIVQGLQNPEVFSSSAITPLDPEPAIPMIPIMLDAPAHTKWRQLLASYFSPRTTRALEGHIRERCVELIESVRAGGGCDFVEDFALRYPTSIFLEICGLPAEELPTFLAWEAQILKPSESGQRDPEQARTAMMAVMQRFLALIGERRANPDPDAPDIISQAATWQIDGEPVQDTDILLCCLLLFMAGLDTVAMQLSFSMHHLATHPRDRARITDPVVAVAAMEEFLRIYPIPEVARKVTRDHVFAGQQLRAGDMVLFPLGAANRDERHVADAHEVDFDRETVPHYAFGAGPHRCLGSHLARQEMRIFFEEWHARIPEYTLAQGAEIREYWGSVHGLFALPLTWPTDGEA